MGITPEAPSLEKLLCLFEQIIQFLLLVEPSVEKKVILRFISVFNKK